MAKRAKKLRKLIRKRVRHLNAAAERLQERAEPRIGRAARYLPAIAVVAAGLFVAGLAHAVFQFGPHDNADLVTRDVTRKTITRTVHTTGTVQPKVTVQVSSALSGQIKELKTDFNAGVSKGDILAVLDQSTFVARVTRAKANLDIAKARLAIHEAAIEKAIAEVAHAKRRYRGQHYFAFIRDRAVANIELTQSKARVEQSKASLRRAEADLAQAEAELDQTRIRAPISGVVISRTVDVGQTVTTSLKAPELFRIAEDLQTIFVETHVSEANIGDIELGQRVRFSVDAYPDRKFKGKVSQIRKAALEQQNVVTYTVMIDALNEDLKLLPGMTALVRIRTARSKDAVRVPVAALRFRPKGIEESRIAEPVTRAGAADGFFRTLSLAPGKAVARQVPAADEAEAAPTPAMASLTDHDVRKPAAPAVVSKEKKGRSASVWVVEANGKLSKRSIRVGIRNDRHAEVLSGELAVGERVVIRKQEAKGK